MKRLIHGRGGSPDKGSEYYASVAPFLWRGSTTSAACYPRPATRFVTNRISIIRVVHFPVPDHHELWTSPGWEVRRRSDVPHTFARLFDRHDTLVRPNISTQRGLRF